MAIDIILSLDIFPLSIFSIGRFLVFKFFLFDRVDLLANIFDQLAIVFDFFGLEFQLCRQYVDFVQFIASVVDVRFSFCEGLQGRVQTILALGRFQNLSGQTCQVVQAVCNLFSYYGFGFVVVEIH